MKNLNCTPGPTCPSCDVPPQFHHGYGSAGTSSSSEFSYMCLYWFVGLTMSDSSLTIGRDLNATKSQTWIPNALSLVQAVFGPLISLASDAFQVRKPILVGTCLVSFIGSAIAPGATSLGRLIAAQVLIGVGFAAAPLAYAIPSEILPRKWRPLAQGFCKIPRSSQVYLSL